MSMFRDVKDCLYGGMSWERRNAAPEFYAVECRDGRTKQDFRDECDINVLMARYERTGVLPTARLGNAFYVDAADLPDYQRSLQIVRDAHESFGALPARVRAEFENDPEAFVRFAQDPANKERLREWGLGAPETPAPLPVEVRVVNPPAEPAD